MNNYVESKQKIDAIRNKYNCKGDIIFRTAIQYVIEYGQSMLSDEAWQEHFMFDIDRRHDEAEKEGKILFCTRQFEKAIFECAFELAEVKAYDLLIYVAKEVYLGGGEAGEPDYQRAMQIVRDCLCYTADCYGSYSLDKEETLDNFRNIGLSDEEIEYFGWGELFEAEEEEDEDDY